MIRAGQALRQPLRNHPPGHLEGRALPWSTVEMLYGQRETVDIPSQAGIAHSGIPQKRFEKVLR